MACFYCSLAYVNAQECGTCCDCGKLVCNQSTCPRPNYHADQCTCGCAEVVCIYHMDNHARTKHKSLSTVCFARTALVVAFGAAGAIERAADQMDPTTAREIFDAVQHFRGFCGQLSITGLAASTNVLPELAEESEWLRLSALTSLLPKVLSNIADARNALSARADAMEWFPQDLDERAREIAALANERENSVDLPIGDRTEQYGWLGPRISLMAAVALTAPTTSEELTVRGKRVGVMGRGAVGAPRMEMLAAQLRALPTAINFGESSYVAGDDELSAN